MKYNICTLSLVLKHLSLLMGTIHEFYACLNTKGGWRGKEIDKYSHIWILQFCGLPQKFQFSRLFQACLDLRLHRRERVCEITKPGAQKLPLISKMFEMLSFNSFWNEIQQTSRAATYLLICNPKFYKSLKEFKQFFFLIQTIILPDF